MRRRIPACLGTRGYAPPEQFGFAQTDARADLYALGATFRQLLGPVARKGRWRHILRRCTALDPKDRYASAVRSAARSIAGARSAGLSARYVRCC